MHVCVRASIAILVALWIAPSALALPAGYALQIDITDSSTGSSLGGADLGTLMGLGMLTETVDTTAGITTLELNGPVSGPSGGWTIQDWDSSVKEDPWITNNFTVSNNTGATKTYTISVSSPIPAFNADTISQSTIQLRLLDSNSTGGATTTSQPGIDVYQGIVNGTTELALLTDPFSLTCANPVDCTLNGTATAGVVSQAFGPVVATNIGLTISFELTAGDSASVLSRFEIVPEPATGMLVGLGVLGLAALRRR